MKKVFDSFLVLLLCLPLISNAQSDGNIILISGNITHPIAGQDILITLAGQRFKIKVKEDRTFTQKIPVKPNKQGIVKGYMSYNMFFVPLYFTKNTHQLHATFDAEKPENFYQTLVFTKSGAKINNYYAAKAKKGFLFGVRRTSKMSFGEYRTKLEERTKDEMALLRTYNEQNNLPANFVQMNQSQIKHRTMTLLCMQADAYKYELPKVSVDQLPDVEGSQLMLQNYTAYLTQKALKSNQQDGVFFKKWYQQASQITGTQRDKTLSNILVQGLQFGFIDDLKTAYQNFKSICKTTVSWQKVEGAYQKAMKLAKGQPAPDFTLEDVNGKAVKLSDFKGKAIYLDFWASWCRPCLGEMPHSKKLKEKFAGKNIVFVYISIDQNKESWKKMMKTKKMDGVHLLVKSQDQRKIMEAYNFMAIPSYFLIDATGKMVKDKAKRPSNPALVQDIETMLEK